MLLAHLAECQRIYVTELRVIHYGRGNPNPGRYRALAEIDFEWNRNPKAKCGTFDFFRCHRLGSQCAYLWIYKFKWKFIAIGDYFLSIWDRLWPIVGQPFCISHGFGHFYLITFLACARSFHLTLWIGIFMPFHHRKLVEWSKRHISFVQNREWRATNLLLRLALWQIDQIVARKLAQSCLLFFICLGCAMGRWNY